MQVAIIGAGGMGGFFGAMLARGGHADRSSPAATNCVWHGLSTTGCSRRWHDHRRRVRPLRDHGSLAVQQWLRAFGVVRRSRGARRREAISGALGDAACVRSSGTSFDRGHLVLRWPAGHGQPSPLNRVRTHPARASDYRVQPAAQQEGALWRFSVPLVDHRFMRGFHWALHDEHLTNLWDRQSKGQARRPRQHRAGRPCTGGICTGCG